MMGEQRGWRLALPNDQDGVAVVLEEAVERLATARELLNKSTF
jgi:hypothetical protein